MTSNGENTVNPRNETVDTTTANHTGSTATGPPTDPATSDALTEVIHASGHENVTGEHSSTFEVTTDDYLTPAGDCIIAIDADRSPADFESAFVEACRDENAKITVTIEAAGLSHSVTGRGDPRLEFTSDRSAVGRTSDYVDERTVVVDADFAASGFDRSLVDALAAGAETVVTITVVP